MFTTVQNNKKALHRSYGSINLPLLLLCNVHVHGFVNIKHSLLLWPGELGEDIQVLLPLSTRVTHNRSKLYTVHINKWCSALGVQWDHNMPYIKLDTQSPYLSLLFHLWCRFFWLWIQKLDINIHVPCVVSPFVTGDKKTGEKWTATI